MKYGKKTNHEQQIHLCLTISRALKSVWVKPKVRRTWVCDGGCDSYEGEAQEGDADGDKLHAGMISFVSDTRLLHVFLLYLCGSQNEVTI